MTVGPITDDELERWLVATRQVNQAADADPALDGILLRLKSRTPGTALAEAAGAPALIAAITSAGLSQGRFVALTRALGTGAAPLDAAQRRKLATGLAVIARQGGSVEARRLARARLRPRRTRRAGLARWMLTALSSAIAAVAATRAAWDTGFGGWQAGVLAAYFAGWLAWPWIHHPLVTLARDSAGRDLVRPILGALVGAVALPLVAAAFWESKHTVGYALAGAFFGFVALAPAESFPLEKD